MKKIILMISILLLVSSSHAENSLTLTATLPGPSAVLNQMRIVGGVSRAGTCDAASEGTVYLNSEVSPPQLELCSDGEYRNFSGVWTRNISTAPIGVYLTDTNDFLGIGTTDPKFKLSLDNDGGILAKGTLGSGVDSPLEFGTKFMWLPKKAALRAGHLDATGHSGANAWANAYIGDYSVAFGHNTGANGDWSGVLSGEKNVAWGNYSFVGGGKNNWSGVDTAWVWGVPTEFEYATVVGGAENKANHHYTFIGGGKENQVESQYSSIVGGQENRIYIEASSHSFIGGGAFNHAGDATIQAWMVGAYSTIGGGYNNEAIGQGTSVLGGGFNRAYAVLATVGGGLANAARGEYSTIAGGLTNGILYTNGDDVQGRKDIHASFIGGGESNTIQDATHSVISGGQGNRVTGHHSTIPGGQSNITAGDYSWVGGKNMALDANADGTFLWGQSDAVMGTPVSTPKAFIIDPLADPTVKVGIGIPNPQAKLHINAVLKLEPTSDFPACNQGIIFSNQDTGALCYCTGTGWANLSDNDAPDLCP